MLLPNTIIILHYRMCTTNRSQMYYKVSWPSNKWRNAASLEVFKFPTVYIVKVLGTAGHQHSLCKE